MISGVEYTSSGSVSIVEEGIGGATQVHVVRRGQKWIGVVGWRWRTVG
jgi:hypothetical protein